MNQQHHSERVALFDDGVCLSTVFNFDMDEVLENVLAGLREVGFELMTGGKLYDLDSADGLVCLSKPSERAVRMR